MDTEALDYSYKIKKAWWLFGSYKWTLFLYGEKVTSGSDIALHVAYEGLQQAIRLDKATRTLANFRHGK